MSESVLPMFSSRSFIVSFVLQKLLILIRSHLFIFAFISNINKIFARIIHCLSDEPDMSVNLERVVPPIPHSAA